MRRSAAPAKAARPCASSDPPRIIAHRCGGALAPENTLAGLRLAARLGCGGVEFDAMLAADGVPVLIHDETLERTTTGRGRVAALDSATLIRLDAGIRHHPAFAVEPLPTLDEALRLCAALGLWANVEIKPAAGQEAETGRVVARHAAAATGGLLLSSFSSLALRAAAEEADCLPRALLVEAIPADWRRRMAETGRACLARRGERTEADALCRRCAMRVFRSPVTRSIAAKTPNACLPWASAPCLRTGPIFGLPAEM
jgi:glycerophosphoryl diester phosphodiesterase